MQSFVSRFNHFRCGSQRCDCSKTSSMHYISLLKVLITTMTNQNLSYGVFVKLGDLLGTLISNNTLRGPRKVCNCNQGPIKKKKKSTNQLLTKQTPRYGLTRIGLFFRQGVSRFPYIRQELLIYSAL